MNLLIFSPSDDFATFVEHWSQLYDPNNNWESSYYKHIKFEKPFTHNDLLKLFEWESQAGLGKIRTAAIKDKIYPHLDYINDMKFEKEIDLKEFNEKFSTVAAVSRTLLLHIIKPEVYPLYDQNIHVAYNFIHGIELGANDYPVKAEKRLKFYFKQLVPFIKSVKGDIPMKKIDEALNTFGQLVKRNPKVKI
jgi:hypothetical protein